MLAVELLQQGVREGHCPIKCCYYKGVVHRAATMLLFQRCCLTLCYNAVVTMGLFIANAVVTIGLFIVLLQCFSV